MKKGFIFDMDGTLVDNMAYHNLAWQSILKDFGVEATMEDVHQKAFGIGAEAYARFFGEGGTAQQIQDFMDAKEARYRELYAEKRSLIRGLKNFLETSRNLGIQMAVGTGSEIPNTQFILDGLAIRPYFGAVVTAENVEKGKPNPETFLKAAALIGCEPENCVVFEDVPSGVEASARAGMRTVALSTLFDAALLGNLPSVVRVISDYEGLNPADF